MVYNRDMTFDDLSNDYLIDGHHKLAAYKELKIDPNVLEITQRFEQGQNLGEPADFMKYLFPWQAQHIFDNFYNNPESIQKIKKGNDDFLKHFIKNGKVTEYWENGTIKSEADYKDNAVIGTKKMYYPNGKAKQITLHWEDGRVKRYLKTWSRTGELSGEFIPKPDYDNGRFISYHKNSRVHRITEYENGRNKDGKSAISYYENGIVAYEATYDNGRVINRRYYDRNGVLTEESDR